MKKQENKHIGTVIHFYEHDFNRKITNYKSFIEKLTPFCEAYKKYGLSPLTIDKLRTIQSGGATSLLSEFTEKINEALEGLSPMVAQAVQSNQEQQIHNFRVLIGQIRQVTQNYQECLADIPVVEGIPAITAEFEETLKDYYSLKVRTADGSEFYDRFLKAQEAIKDLLSTGAQVNQHFELLNSGLVCQAIYE